MHSANPLVSIIIPTLNQGQYIGYTIDSILAQTYSPIEIIVIDGGSKDNTLNVLSRYGDKINWISEPDDGQVDAIEKGVDRAHGSIFAWLNSDDTYFPYTVEHAVKALQTTPSSGAVYADAQFIDENNNFLAPYTSMPFDLRTQLYKPNPIPQPSTFIRKDVYLEVGRLNKSLHFVFDYELWFRIALRYGMKRFDEVWSNYRWWSDSKSLRSAPKFREEILNVVEQLFDRETLAADIVQERDRVFCALHLHAVGSYAEYTDDAAQVEAHARAALQRYPQCAQETDWVYEMIAHVGPRGADKAFTEFRRIAIAEGLLPNPVLTNSAAPPTLPNVVVPSRGTVVKARIRQTLAPYTPRSIREIYRMPSRVQQIEQIIGNDLQLAWYIIRELQGEVKRLTAVTEEQGRLVSDLQSQHAVLKSAVERVEQGLYQALESQQTTSASQLKSAEQALYDRISSLERQLQDHAFWRAYESLAKSEQKIKIAETQLYEQLQKQDQQLRAGVTHELQRIRNTFNRQLYGKAEGDALSYSQHGEDTIAWKFFNQTRGTYIDVGAFDGVELSNTCLFDDLGWGGICVEPDPTNFDRLKRNRPSAINVQAAASSSNGHIEMIVDPLHLYGGTNTDVEAIEAAYAEIGQPWTGLRHIRVQTRTLDSILEDAGMEQVALASIDVEGSELDVLRGFDLARWKPQLLILEANSPEKKQEIEGYLQSQGYVLAHSILVNHFFVRPEDVERLRKVAGGGIKPQTTATAAQVFDSKAVVICCGMMRSGSTLQYNIAREIVERLGLGHGLGELYNQENVERFLNESADSPHEIAILKAHDYTENVERLHYLHAMKALYIYRDIRDVVVSWMQMQNLSFDEIDAKSFVASCLANYKMWTSLPDVLVSQYETVTAEGGVLNEVNRIADYLGVELDETTAAEIADRVSIEKQRAYIQQFDFENHGLASGRTFYDPKTHLHNRHINSGASGQWRTVLTKTQQQLILEWAGDWLKDRGYLEGDE